MGFAYYPDGDHDGKIELEPTVSWESEFVAPEQQAANNGTTGGSLCSSTATCPAPLYFNGDTFLGNYSNLAQSFGLDMYEPLFSHPVSEWNAMNFSVRLNFNDDTYGRDIFYFCHVRIDFLMIIRQQPAAMVHVSSSFPIFRVRRFTNTCRDGSNC
jgi:hypothetical protein